MKQLFAWKNLLAIETSLLQMHGQLAFTLHKQTTRKPFKSRQW